MTFKLTKKEMLTEVVRRLASKMTERAAAAEKLMREARDAAHVAEEAMYADVVKRHKPMRDRLVNKLVALLEADSPVYRTSDPGEARSRIEDSITLPMHGQKGWYCVMFGSTYIYHVTFKPRKLTKAVLAAKAKYEKLKEEWQQLRFQPERIRVEDVQAKLLAADPELQTLLDGIVNKLLPDLDTAFPELAE